MPVYLWQLGLPLGGLCLLVGVSGLAFSAALSLWQRLSRVQALASLIGSTFALELLLVACVALAGVLLGENLPPMDDPGSPTVPAAGTSASPAAQAAVPALASAPALGVVLSVAFLVGAANGLYNAFYWTTQRTLFTALGTERDSGRRYGNLQIIVAGFLKVGLLAGGFLLETDGLHWILLLSALVSLIGARALAADAGEAPLQHEPHLTLVRALAYRDRRGSRRVFAIDGLFLYLESHFWTLSLFLLVREDHSRLGLIVVILGIVFALLFLLVKNRIDRPGAADAVYRASVWLYALAWLLRLAVDGEAAASATLVLLVGITFCSSLFRLAFNKRFFDIARHGLQPPPAGATAPAPPPTPRSRPGAARHASPSPPRAGVETGLDETPRLGPVGYLIAKSHASQLCMAALFLPLGVLVSAGRASDAVVLDTLYAVAALLSLGYLGYRRPHASRDGRALPALPADRGARERG